MKTELTNVEKLRLLPWNVAFTAANAVFCHLTVFGAVFILFLSELSLPKTQIGLILSFFPFCGILALFIAPTVARIGLKRTFIICWGIRNIVVAFLLLTPWILARFGFRGTFIYVAGSLLVFAFCRAIGETAFYPWFQEVIPDSIRGKYGGISNIIVTLVSCLTLGIASYVLGHSEELSRFMVLIAAGVIFGLVSIWCVSFVPGGKANRSNGAETGHSKQMMKVLQDKNFLLYLGGIGATIVSISFLTFIPLFMKEQVGLSPGNVVMLQTGTLIGGLLSGYLWGWAADRYGSKPVMLSGLHMMTVLPICWLLMPRHSVWSSLAAMTIAFLYGSVTRGWLAGSNRLLYVDVVPSEKKTQYMAIYYAWIGFIGGSGQLIAGRTLDYCKGLTGKFFIFTLDPYTPLFAMSFALLVLGALLLRQVRAGSAMSPTKFVGMFLRGNPFVAAESLVRYSLAKKESARVSMTERLGDAKSPLNVDELLEALSDPSFNVRHEAIISIARTRRDDRLVNALIQVLRGNNPDLSIAAAWALGKIGDRKAINPLRNALASGYPLLQARSARALATLGDTDSIPLLLSCFRNEADDGLRIAYASALGTLKSTDSMSEILTLLCAMQDKGPQMELALALARMFGNEHYFIRLSRQIRTEIGTATSQAVHSLKKKTTKLHMDSHNLMTVTEDCAQAFAKGDLKRGTALLSDVISNLPMEKFGETFRVVLHDCMKHLDKFGASRIEYIVLSLHTVDAALNSLLKKG